jgi:indolepyruvate decarboxylase
MDIANALIEALLQRGVRRVYGVPGDYVLGLFDRFEQSPIEMVCTAGEEGAGFAADAHARLHGLGVAVVTYGVGALKLLNPVAGAYAERSPVLVISGAPGVRESDEHGLLHHSIRASDTQQRFFNEVCAETARLNSGRTAAGDITKVLLAMQRESRPGYLELPRDCLARPLPWPLAPQAAPAQAPEPAPLHRQRGEILLSWMRTRQRPVVLAGIELHRFGLQADLLALLEREGWPFATSLSAKSLLNERHPLCLGLYEGAAGPAAVREQVEGSDGLLILGMPLQDLDTGIFTMQLNAEQVVRVEMNQGLRWSQGDLDSLDPVALLQVWKDAPAPKSRSQSLERPSPVEPVPFMPATGVEISVRRLISALNQRINPDMVVVADPGDALFAAADLRLPAASDFLACGYWASLGFAIPAAIGAWGGSPNPKVKPLVLLGDGSFLMSANELATLARYHIPALVVVLDNGGYGTERPMLDGPFNDVQPVDHVALARAYGFQAARRVQFEEDLDQALTSLLALKHGPTLISVELKQGDVSEVLRNLTAALAKRVNPEPKA